MHTPPSRLIRVALPLLAAAIATTLAFAPSAAEAAPLTCSGTAVNAVGAHAGSLSIRVGLTLNCDEQASFEVILPGGASASFDTDASGSFTGVAGDAYVCSGHPQPVAVVATGASGDWSGLLTIGTESGAPAPAGGPGQTCDLMLHPGFNYVTYDGPLADPATALANDHFTAVLPFGDSSSSNGADHIMAVFESVPGATPAERQWVQWRPGAPAAVNGLHTLVPGHSYAILTDAELAWTYAASSTP